MNDHFGEPVIIEARGIDKNYTDGNRKLQVFERLSLSIRSGEGVCILGPSGSGKTTLLNILSGLDSPSQGQVLLNGKNLVSMNENEKAALRNEQMGFVFQFYHLIQELSALENIVLPALIRKKGLKREDAFERGVELLKKVGLSQRASHFPSELSGGEQQRVAIARALMNNPSVLFCDEPTGNLDRERGGEIADLLRDLFVKEKKTVLIVTHDERIAKMADRVWDMASAGWLVNEERVIHGS